MTLFLILGWFGLLVLSFKGAELLLKKSGRL
jgi:hypothetical protein